MHGYKLYEAFCIVYYFGPPGVVGGHLVHFVNCYEAKRQNTFGCINTAEADNDHFSLKMHKGDFLC